MSLSMQWVGLESLEQIARTRLQCYAPSPVMEEEFRRKTAADPFASSADFLLAEKNGEYVGTTTSYKLKMWLTGREFACQGVAWVGTIRTHRRRSSASAQGIASQLMRQTILKAREQEQVLSALMPFRASFYEHFGYGTVEKRCKWHVPLSLIPSAAGGTIHHFTPDDAAQMQHCRQRITRAGQCDIERPADAWKACLDQWSKSWVMLDKPAEGQVHGWCVYTPIPSPLGVDVSEIAYDSIDSLKRLLGFLGSLRDQYGYAQLTLPAVVDLLWLLKETQIPHRPVPHATATPSPYTRMQLRILDHRKFIQGLKLKPAIQGKLRFEITESEGATSTFTLDFQEEAIAWAELGTHLSVSMPDRVYAAIASGALSPDFAHEAGLLTCSDPKAIPLLRSFSQGPMPYCHDFF